MEQKEKNMELDEVSLHVGMDDSQRAQTSDQTNNEVKLESEFVEFTESNEDNETIETVNVNYESVEVKLEPEFINNDDFTESNEANEDFQFVNCESVKVTYIQLITEAIENAPNGMLVSSDICIAISDTHPQFKLDEPNWQNGIRHTLSINKHFVKETKTKNGWYWKLKDEQEVSAPKNQIIKDLDPLSCGFCDKQFAQKRNLVRHIQTVHEKKKPFCCSLCDTPFGTKQTLERHFAKVHKIQDSSDLIHWTDPKVKKRKGLNEESFNSNGNHLDEELLHPKKEIKLEPKWPKDTKSEIIRENYCSICKKQFCNSTSLKNHMEKVHEGKKSKKPGPKSKACPYCGKTFPGGGLKYHVQAIHEGKKFECLLCDKKFTLQKTVIDHFELFHVPVTCDNCNTELNSQHSLKKHICGKKTAQCSMCNMNFKQRKRLVKHVLDVHDGKIFGKPLSVCLICEKKFLSEGKLSWHMTMVHDVKKPEENKQFHKFNCQVDDCTFSSDIKTNFIRHKVTVHEEEKPYECSKCDYKG